MPLFAYIALKNNKTIVRGKIEADDIKSAREGIKKIGLLPTKIIDESNKNASEQVIKLAKANLKPMSLKDKIEFTSTLQILTATGIPIIETLVFMENNAETTAIRDIAYELRRQIIAGSTLAETLEKYRSLFGRVYVGLVKAGEDSGELDKTLASMLELLKKQDAIKGKVIGALIYPAFVLVLAAVVVTIMLMFVFPAFSAMFDNLGRDLPWATKVCIELGTFMRKFWYVLIIGVGVIAYGIRKIFTTEASRKVVDRYILKVPLLSDLMRYANYSNFLAVLQVAYDAGIPVVDCLYLSNLTMDNVVLKQAILGAAAKVQQGIHLSIALRSTKQIPNMMLFMIATGEQSGRLGEMLYHCTTFIDRKLDDIIDKFTKLVEPALLIFIGFVVLFLALSLYMPLFAAYQQ